MAENNKTNVLPVKHTTFVLQRLDEQRLKGLFCDATLIVEGEKFQVHRSFLAANSNYFMSLFTSAEEQNTFVLAGVPLAGFRVLLDFVYTATFVLNISTVHDVYKASSALDFQHVQTACEKVYKKIKQMERNVHAHPSPTQLHRKKTASNADVIVNNGIKSKGAALSTRVYRESTFKHDQIHSDDSTSPNPIKTNKNVTKNSDIAESVVRRKGQETYKRKFKLKNEFEEFFALNNSPKRVKNVLDASDFQPAEGNLLEGRVTSSVGIDHSRLSPFVISNIKSEASVTLTTKSRELGRLNHRLSPSLKSHSSEETKNMPSEKEYMCTFKATLADDTVELEETNSPPNTHRNEDVLFDKFKSQRNKRKMFKTTRISTNNEYE